MDFPLEVKPRGMPTWHWDLKQMMPLSVDEQITSHLESIRPENMAELSRAIEGETRPAARRALMEYLQELQKRQQAYATTPYQLSPDSGWSSPGYEMKPQPKPTFFDRLRSLFGGQ